MQTELDFNQTFFFNTINLTGMELNSEQGKAKGQEEIVMDFFRYKNQSFTSEKVWKNLLSLKLISNRVPKDSIKRAMSNLSHPKKAMLVKTNEMELGEYGKPLHKYKLA